MGFRCGIVGLPNVGKSTLFNALTETAAAQAANYPFCTIEPNVGQVAVPDPRLYEIARIGGSAKIIETQLGFVDIRSEEHKSELQTLMRISYAVFCLIKKKTIKTQLI